MGITPPGGGSSSKPPKNSDKVEKNVDKPKAHKGSTQGSLARARILSASSESVATFKKNSSSSGVAWDEGTSKSTALNKAPQTSSNLIGKAKSVPNLENLGSTLSKSSYGPLSLNLGAVLTDGNKWGNDIHFVSGSSGQAKKIKPLKNKNKDKIGTPEIYQKILLALADIILRDVNLLSEEGIFRHSGIKSVIEKSVDNIQKKGASAKLQDVLTADITSIIKALLKEIAKASHLVESLVWFKDNKFNSVDVPEQHKENVIFLNKLGFFLAKIASNSGKNKMDAENLVIVFSPNFPDSSKGSIDTELFELIKHFEEEMKKQM